MKLSRVSSCQSYISLFLYTWPLLCLFFFFISLGQHLWHMEVPRLGVESELQLLAYATATAMLLSELCLQPTPQLTATLDP